MVNKMPEWMQRQLDLNAKKVDSWPPAKQRWAGRGDSEMANNYSYTDKGMKFSDDEGKEVHFTVTNLTPSSKPWYKSKSLLIAGITIALAGLGAYQQGGDPVSIAIVVLGALSAAVRTVTSTRLTK